MRQKTLFIILAVLSVSLAVVLGYQKLIQSEISPIAVEQPVAATSDETAGWKTYKNEQYEFEMKYPKNWYVYHSVDSGVGVAGFTNLSEDELKTKQELGDVENVYTFTIKIINGQIDNWLQEQQRWSEALEIDFLKEKITIGENEGYKISSTVEDKRGFAKVLFIKEKVYLIETLFPAKCRYEECEIFNQMLSTFKFIK